ncbi:VOC family protein [Arthrobacter sp. TMN-37]
MTIDLLPPDTGMSTVTLKVGNLDAMARYYTDALGLEAVAGPGEDGSGGLYLGRGTTALIHLSPAAGLRLPAPTEAGLFHTALLFGSRADLAATVATAARHPGSRFAGSADHLVSEAFYFADPEGNGIELYFDKPRESWNWTGTGASRSVVMDNRSLPPDRYLADHLTERAAGGLREAGAGVGHVHLQVGDIDTARAFYVDTLGFERTAGWHGQALFVSAGGYHHHMAMNVWNSRGAGPRRDTLGLGEVLITVPAADDVEALADRLRVAGVGRHSTGAELRFRDPWNNSIRVTVGAPGAGIAQNVTRLAQ